MTADRRRPLNRKLDAVAAYILRIGVIAAALIVLAGGLLYVFHNSSATVHYHRFHAASSRHDNLAGIARNIRALNDYGIIQLGLLVLIATPVVRVMFSVVAFALERDKLYVAAASIVLAILLYSLFATGT